MTGTASSSINLNRHSATISDAFRLKRRASAWVLSNGYFYLPSILVILMHAGVQISSPFEMQRKMDPRVREDDRVIKSSQIIGLALVAVAMGCGCIAAHIVSAVTRQTNAG